MTLIKHGSCRRGDLFDAVLFALSVLFVHDLDSCQELPDCSLRCKLKGFFKHLNDLGAYALEGLQLFGLCDVVSCYSAALSLHDVGLSMQGLVMTFAKLRDCRFLSLELPVKHQHPAPVQQVLELMHLVVCCCAARENDLCHKADLVNDVFNLVDPRSRVVASGVADLSGLVLLARLLVSWHLLVPSLVF